MHKLAASNRCWLFKEIAEDVWNLIVANSLVSVHTNEDGITNNIIGRIRTHAKSIPNFGVWSNRGYNESKWGSDIDIFVETSPSQFVWYALQAKVLSGKYYKDLYTLKGGEHQWEKLERLKRFTQCEIRYLLYNGVDGYSYKGADQCSFSFDHKQFGCSLVTIADIKANQGTKAKFTDFHPHKAQPWRVMVCCFQDLGSLTTYDVTQIKKAVDHYPRDTEKINPDILDQDIPRSDANIDTNLIVNASERAGWTPEVTIVIRNTSSL